MANRLMTPFCFASMLAALLVAEGALAAPFPAPANARPDSSPVPLEPIGGLDVYDTGAVTWVWAEAWDVAPF